MKKLFIADDNEDLLGLMQSVFSKDYTVYCTAHTDNIFEEISKFEPDLIIIDNCFGDTSSEIILEKLKKKDSSFSIPFVLFSANPSIKEIAHKLGANGYIEKPFSMKDLKAYVNEIIQKQSNHSSITIDLCP